MELIDTHCHLTFDELAGDIDASLQRSRDAGVTSWITVGTDAFHDRKAVELAAGDDNLYAALGIHPHFAGGVTAAQIAELSELAGNLKVVAIGETGLDFHYDHSTATCSAQHRLFVRHLNLAAELNRPVIVHCRDAFEETVDTLERFAPKPTRVVFHCFSGSPEQARIVLDHGYHISFTGVVTFKNAEGTRAAAAIVPLDRLMLETDCPYMSPEPMRKQRINEPALMVHTAGFLAELKGMDLPSFAANVTSTTRCFFNLPRPQ